MMERADSSQKLYTRMRLWEFPDQYIVEPTDGSCGSSLAISRKDGSMNLIGELIIIHSRCSSNITFRWAHHWCRFYYILIITWHVNSFEKFVLLDLLIVCVSWFVFLFLIFVDVFFLWSSSRWASRMQHCSCS